MAVLCLRLAQAMGAVAADALDGLPVGAVIPQLPGSENW